MAVGGDSSAWSSTFPDDLIPPVLQAIIDAWQAMSRIPADAKEEPTTRQLREILRGIKNVRQLPFTVWPESSETDSRSGREIGRIDLRFVPGFREEVYLSFECKRLYFLTAEGKVRANVAEYTGDDGMMCYITEKYASGLPHGGMIGYVLTGSVLRARDRIRKRMLVRRQELMLKSDPPLLACVHNPGDVRLSESIHEINGRRLVIYHVLLANSTLEATGCG